MNQLKRATDRAQKGLKRGIQLLAIGYLLRLNLGGLLSGEVYPTFFMVDVLHCIGFSLIGIIGLYLISGQKKSYLFPVVLTTVGIALFVFEPQYTQWTYTGWPAGLANYLTKANGSVFTVFPWFGYAALGGALSYLFNKWHQKTAFYPVVIAASLLIGATLIYRSSAFFLDLHQWSGWGIFEAVEQNNYLFIRLGNVFVALAIFMAVRRWFTHPTVIRIGQVTLSIYVIHYIFLYGSFTGIGFYRFWHDELSPEIVIPGALAFMVLCTSLALLYNRKKNVVQDFLFLLWDRILIYAELGWSLTKPVLKKAYYRIRWWVLRLLFAKRQS